MSESDETGVLLLIPPDFFAVDTSSTEESKSLCENTIDNQKDHLNAASRKMNSDCGNGKFEDYCERNFESNLDCFNQERFLKEIDSYLGANNRTRLPSDSFLDGNFQIDLQEITRVEPRLLQEQDPMNVPLISLTEIWNRDNKTDSPHILEEQVRRKHLEKTLENAQKNLFESQQKVSVALKVDRVKDEVIAKLKQNVRELQLRVTSSEHLSKTIHILEHENIELRKKCQMLENDIERGLEMAKTFQERNSVLEDKVVHLTTATTDIREINKKQIEDLQIRLSNAIKAEQMLNDDLVKTRNQMLLEKKCHKDSQEMWSRKDKNLQCEIDAVRNSLKHFYQNQLEDVVSRKLSEFQKQMDDTENTMKMDYLRRERQIAERAVQQMELVFKKNDQEIQLMQEKHKEEVNLYQLQLDGARAAIEDARERLNGYHTQQAMVAERTGIMKDDFDEIKFKRSLFSTPHRRNDHSTHSPDIQNYIEMVRNLNFQLIIHYIRNNVDPWQIKLSIV